MKCCIDIGGTNIRIAIYDNNKFLKRYKFKNYPNDFNLAKTKIIKFLQGFKIKEMSIGMPGPADYSRGIMKNPPNLPDWFNVNLKKFFLETTSAEKIHFENDACLMALAHHYSNGGNKNKITQFFTISTGIGAGLIIDNNIYKGFSGLAQSVAHLPINSIEENNHLSKGAVEYFSSGSGICSRGLKYKFKNTKEVFENYTTNNNARKIIDQGIDGLANLIASSIALINPSDIVFDGSISRNEKWYIRKAIDLAKTRMYSQQADSFEWHISSLGDDAVLKGCLILLNKENNEI